MSTGVKRGVDPRRYRRGLSVATNAPPVTAGINAGFSQAGGQSVGPRNVALLSNFLAPYRIELMSELAARFEKLSILLSSPMESDRDWKPEWGDLPVHIQRNLSISVRVRHPQFADRTIIQIPYDTVPQLARRRPDVVVAANSAPAPRRRQSTAGCSGAESWSSGPRSPSVPSRTGVC